MTLENNFTLWRTETMTGLKYGVWTTKIFDLPKVTETNFFIQWGCRFWAVEKFGGWNFGCISF